MVMIVLVESITIWLELTVRLLYLQLPQFSPASVTLQPAPGDTGKVSRTQLTIPTTIDGLMLAQRWAKIKSSLVQRHVFTANIVHSKHQVFIDLNCLFIFFIIRR